MSFNIQEFKRNVRTWVKLHPKATEEKLLQYCEEQIPASLRLSHSWLTTHTLSWWKYQKSLEEAPVAPAWFVHGKSLSEPLPFPSEAS